MGKKRGLSVTKLIGGGLANAARLLTLPFGAYGARIAAHASGKLAPIITIRTPRGLVRYSGISSNVVRHATQMLTREPDTIAWLEEYVRPGDHMWDVGANIGIYSIYACLRDGVTATAFEPVASNFQVLTQAVILNTLGECITPLALGLSDRTGLATIYLLETAPGTGLHALDSPQNVRGRFTPEASISVPVMRGEDVITQLGARTPTHVKIDVDGHEEKVLEGLRGVLPQVSTVWIEMTADAGALGDNARIEQLLLGMGFARGALRSGQQGENQLYLRRG